MSPFERFQPPAASRRREGPTITVTQRGALNLSTEAVELLGGAANVVLLWDRDGQVLGIEPTSPGDSAGLRLLVTRQARSISAKRFLDWAGIDYATARRWPAELEDGVLYADLSEPGEDVTSNRAEVHSPAGAGRVPPRTGGRNPRR